MPGASARPQPRVQMKKAHEHSHRRYTPVSPGIPGAMVFRLASCSPRGTGFLAPVTLWIISQSLMPASRHQDHTTSPTASCAFVFRAKASTASRTQRLVTIAKRPSEEAGRKRYISASTESSRKISENPKSCHFYSLCRAGGVVGRGRSVRSRTRGQAFPASSGAKMIVSEK